MSSSSVDESCRRLLRHLSADMKQLTLKEVQDMKWPLRKKIIILLFEGAGGGPNPLSSQYEDIERLIESRSKQLVHEKRGIANGTLDTEERKETEMLHRTQFLRITIEGLISLRWPPAMEAFSDPLNDLLHDKHVFIDAIFYIHQMAFGGSGDAWRGNGGGGGGDGSVRSYIEQHSQSQSLSPKATAAATRSPDRGPGPAASNQDTSFSSDDDDQTGAGGGRGKEDEPPFPGAPIGTSKGTYDSTGTCTGIGIGIKEMGVGVLDISGITDNSPQGTCRGTATSTARSGACISRGGAGSAALSPADQQDRTSLLSNIHILQRQNELLGSQLQALYTANNKRDESERKVDAIFVDLMSAVDEAVSLGGGGGGGKNKEVSSHSSNNSIESAYAAVSNNPYISSTDPAFVTHEEDAAYRREVERERVAKQSKSYTNISGSVGMNMGSISTSTTTSSGSKRLDTGLGSSSGAGIGIVGGNKVVTSNLIWKQVSSKLKFLHTQWLESRSDARNVQLKYYEEQRRIRKQNSSNNSASSSRGGRAGTGGGGSERGRGSMSSRGGGDFTLGSPSNAAMTVDNTVDYDEGNSVFLDVHRTHALQRELLNFSSAAYRLLHDDGNGDTGAGGGHSILSSAASSIFSAGSSSSSSTADPLPTNQRAFNQTHAIQVLQRKAQELVLHLSSHASTSPLTLDSNYSQNSNSNGNDSGNGIQTLVREIETFCDITNFRKKDIKSWQRLQQACDSAKNEHSALTHVLHRYMRQQQRSIAASKAMAPLMEQFSINSQKMLRSALGPIQPHLKAIESILIAVEEAEHPKNMVQDKKGARVQPLDMLSRGYLGEATSNLISTLRIHKNDLSELSSNIASLHRNLNNCAQNEMNALNSAKERVLAALTVTLPLSSSSSTAGTGAGMGISGSASGTGKQFMSTATPPKRSTSACSSTGTGLGTFGSPDWGEMAYQNVAKQKIQAREMKNASASVNAGAISQVGHSASTSSRAGGRRSPIEHSKSKRGL